MLKDNDIRRLLIELQPRLEGEDPIEDWLAKEDISSEVWEKMGDDIAGIVAEDVMENVGKPRAGYEAMRAGIQLAFFVGWMASKQYAPRRDMSQQPKE